MYLDAVVVKSHITGLAVVGKSDQAAVLQFRKHEENLLALGHAVALDEQSVHDLVGNLLLLLSLV
jgi:hypothetical protein